MIPPLGERRETRWRSRVRARPAASSKLHFFRINSPLIHATRCTNFPEAIPASLSVCFILRVYIYRKIFVYRASFFFYKGIYKPQLKRSIWPFRWMPSSRLFICRAMDIRSLLATTKSQYWECVRHTFSFFFDSWLCLSYCHAKQYSHQITILYIGIIRLIQIIYKKFQTWADLRHFFQVITFLLQIFWFPSGGRFVKVIL